MFGHVILIGISLDQIVSVFLFKLLGMLYGLQQRGKKVNLTLLEWHKFWG